MNPFTYTPRGPGILLGSRQPMPRELYGHVTWAAVYMGSMFDSHLAECREANVHDIFVWAEPNAWVISTYEASIARAEHLCTTNGLRGYIVDIETPMSEAQASAFGAALKASTRRGFSVGLTSFAGYRSLPDIAESCDGTVWTLCQIYNQGSNQARVFAEWLGHMRALFGHSIPLIPAYIPTRGHGPELASMAGYEAFLAKIPQSDAIGFYGTNHTMLARLASYRSASVLNTALWLIGLPTVWHMPVTTAVVISMLIVVGFFIAAALTRRKT